MNTIFKTLATCLLIGLVFSCEKEKFEAGGTATSLLNDTTLTYSAGASAFEPNGFSFAFVFTELNIARMEFVVRNIPVGVGAHQIVPRTSNGTAPQGVLFTMDHDLALDDYRILDGEANTFSITKLDTVRQKVSGRFDLTFVIDTTFTFKKDGFPDTIRLRSGEFDINYRK
jgi:hypothetical protein